MSDILLVFPNMHVKCLLTIESQHLPCSSFVYSFKRNDYITFLHCEALKKIILYNNTTHRMKEWASVCMQHYHSIQMNLSLIFSRTKQSVSIDLFAGGP